MTLKQKQIVETAQTLFFRHGTKRVSIEEICKTASVSKVTFYKYYKNKLDLIKFIRDSLIDKGFAQFDLICEQDISYREKVNQMTQWRMEFFSQMKGDFIEDILSLQDIKSKIKIRMIKNINTAQERGEIRKEYNPELIWMVSEKLGELVTEGIWKDAFNDYGEYQKQMRNLFFNGLLEEDK